MNRVRRRPLFEVHSSLRTDTNSDLRVTGLLVDRVPPRVGGNDFVVLTSSSRLLALLPRCRVRPDRMGPGPPLQRRSPGEKVVHTRGWCPVRSPRPLSYGTTCPVHVGTEGLSNVGPSGPSVMYLGVLAFVTLHDISFLLCSTPQSLTLSSELQLKTPSPHRSGSSHMSPPSDYLTPWVSYPVSLVWRRTREVRGEGLGD